MRHLPSTRSPAPLTGPAPAPARKLCVSRRAAVGIGVAVVLLALVGCTQPIRSGEDLVRQVQEIGCISRCQEIKDRCDDDARFDYAQCQSGYSGAMRNYRWCLASNRGECGYPWWSCSENRYGYCSNRYWECHNACRRTAL